MRQLPPYFLAQRAVQSIRIYPIGKAEERRCRKKVVANSVWLSKEFIAEETPNASVHERVKHENLSECTSVITKLQSNQSVATTAA